MELLMIFGTAHSLQMGSATKDTERDCLLKEEVESVCATNKIALIAEEMSNEALMRAKIPRTIGQLVASEQRIDHLFCDPPSELRSVLGIRDTQAIKLDALLENWTEERRDGEIKKSWSLREDCILSCIQSVKRERVLLICGANHVQEFASKAKSRGVSVGVICEDWEYDKGSIAKAGKDRAG